MIAMLDAAYAEDRASVACVLATAWTSSVATREHAMSVGASAPYQSGEFYKRELPLLLAILNEIACAPSCIVIDGYVWLDGNGKPGLGAHLYAALNEAIPVVGVAKSRLTGHASAVEVRRGESANPLLVTSAGMSKEVAADHVRSMHGAFRVPTLLKRVDAVARAKCRR